MEKETMDCFSKRELLEALIKKVEQIDERLGQGKQAESTKTIAQQLNVKEFPFIIRDGKQNLLYREQADEVWERREYNEQGFQTYYEDSTGQWRKKEFDEDGNQIYFEDSNGYWAKREYNKEGDVIYFKDSRGGYFDNRPEKVTLTMDEIAEKFNIPVEQLKIKDS